MSDVERRSIPATKGAPFSRLLVRFVRWTEEVLSWPLIVTFILVGLGIAFYGFASKVEDFSFTRDFPNVVWQSLALLLMQSSVDPMDPDTVVWARFMLAFASVGTFFRFFVTGLVDEISEVALTWVKHPAVMIGDSQVARAFMRTMLRSPEQDRELTILYTSKDPLPIEEEYEFRKAHFHTRSGDVRNARELGVAGVKKADRIFILGDGDTENLAIAEEVVHLNSAERRAGNIAGVLNVAVRVDDPELARHLEQDQDFCCRDKDGCAATPEGQHRTEMELFPFNPDRVAARQFFERYPLVDRASLRAQRRVHLVIVGWSGFAFALMEQLARLSPYRDFTEPRVDLFVKDRNAVRSAIEAAQPAFLATSLSRNVIDLKIHQLDAWSGIPTLAQIEQVEPGARSSVTAAVVTMGSDDASTGVAMALRDRLDIAGRWQGPVFVKVASRLGLDSLLNSRYLQIDDADRVIPVGLLEDVCDPAALWGAREKMAERLHEAYVKVAEPRADFDPESPSNQPWRCLEQTFRQANRRAVDHLFIKLLDAGYWVEARPLRGGSGFKLEEAQIEELARREHRSWEIERLLQGWRTGKTKDNRARINPSIGKTYDQLDAFTQGFDLKQIDACVGLLQSSGAPTFFREIRLGIIGNNQMTAEDLAVVDAELGVEAPLHKDFAEFLEANRDACISVYTPLAPGSDLILTERVLAWLKGHGVQHRLVIVRSLPPESVVDDFVANVYQGGRWSSRDPGALRKEVEDFVAEKRAFVQTSRPDGSVGDDAGADEDLSEALRKKKSGLESKLKVAIHDSIHALEGSLIEEALKRNVRPDDEDQRVEQERLRRIARRQPRRIVVANLQPPGATREIWNEAERRRDAYCRANAYIAQRCDAILAYFDAGKAPGECGTVSALNWYRDPETIPAIFRTHVDRPPTQARPIFEIVRQSSHAS